MKRLFLLDYLSNKIIFIFLLIIMQPLMAAPATEESLKNVTPTQVLQRLIEGNHRFVTNQPIKRDLLKQAKSTNAYGQYPYAIILSCMDSRGSPDLIFDQGIGSIFSIRVAGNVIDPDQLGSMEYAVQLIGTKLILVMGHTNCGAVQGACKQVKLGNLTQLLNKIESAVQAIKEKTSGKLVCENTHTIDAIAKEHVMQVMKDITKSSVIISTKLSNHEILLVGAIHDLGSGVVHFFNQDGSNIN